MQNRPRILFISLEFSSWQSAKSWSYTAHLGLEEGFAANGIDCLTIPAHADVTQTDAKSWLSRARQLCEGKKFDQVWIEIVHTNPDESFLNWLETIAPVRIGLVGESLQYQSEAYQEAPHLKERRMQVEKRLRYMTHALTVDEADAEDLSSRGVVKALWWVSAVPERFIGECPEPPRLDAATFCGALYGKRASWLEHPELRSLLVKQGAPEDGTPYPALFGELHRVADAYLASGAPIDTRYLAAFMSPLRRIRQEIFDLWIKGLRDGVAVVNLPSFFQGYAGRVFEGMAAGRPIITWEIPNRPRTNALFADDAEILLFPGDSPEALTEQIRHIQRDPAFANRIAAAARRKLWRHHTVEKRVRQIMHWIESGVEPSYTEEYPSESLSHSLQSFSELFSSKGSFPAADSPEQNYSDVARQKELAARLTQANEAISCHDIARAIALLEETDRNFPGEVDVQGILQTLRSIQKEEAQSQRDDPYYTKLFLEHPAWSNPHPNDDEQARWACISQILQMVANSQRGVTPPRILDLGSGRGWLTNLASSFGESEGIEPVEEVAAVAGKLFPHLTFSHGTAETLLKRSDFQPYDIVLNSEVIEHVPREEQKEFVKNLSMLVTKGGHAIITSPRAEAYDQWMEYTNFSRQPIDDWLTEHELEGLFKEMGFRTIHFERIYYDMLGKRYILRPSPDEETGEGVVALYQVWGFNKF
ncbi:glycosyltransferase [Geobacter sp.]|uniref:glycosyltransferase family protein n=1 Tax=Geobacter sp. TaxID=46610 RepID=UPI002623E331|nr:glycosyltransferase [Geobacter sp.]